MLQEELDLKPGHSFLDVGSGCGIIAACAAYLVSPLPPRHTCAHKVLRYAHLHKASSAAPHCKCDWGQGVAHVMHAST